MFHSIFLMAAVAAQINPEAFEIIRQLALILVLLLEGGLVVPAVKALKNAFGLSGWKSFVLAAVVSAVFGTVTVIADGTITGESFAWTNLSGLFTAVFVASQVIYRMLKDNDAAKA